MTRLFSLAMKSFELAKKSENVSLHTTRFYDWQLGRFQRWVQATHPDCDLPDVDVNHVREYLVTMREEGLSDSTVQAAHRALRPFFKFCVEEGFLRQDPTERVKRPTVERRDKDIIPKGGIQKLLDACLNNRDRAIVACLLDTGCRASEFLRWKVEDVNIQTKAVKVMGKNRSERHVFLGNRAMRYLIQWLAESRIESGWIWVNRGDGIIHVGQPLTVAGLHQVLKRLGKRAGVSPCNPHAFRRTFATSCLRNGMDIYTLQRMMGHRTLDMLRHYLSFIHDDLLLAHQSYAPMDRIQAV